MKKKGELQLNTKRLRMVNFEERRLYSSLCDRLSGRLVGILIFTFIAVWVVPIIINSIPYLDDRAMYTSGGFAFLCLIIQLFIRDITLDKALKKEFETGNIILKELEQDDNSREKENE